MTLKVFRDNENLTRPIILSLMEVVVCLDGVTMLRYSRKLALLLGEGVEREVAKHKRYSSKIIYHEIYLLSLYIKTIISMIKIIIAKYNTLLRIRIYECN